MFFPLKNLSKKFHCTYLYFKLLFLGPQQLKKHWLNSSKNTEPSMGLSSSSKHHTMSQSPPIESWLCVLHVSFSRCRKDRKMALVQMATVEEAIEALIVSPSLPTSRRQHSPHPRCSPHPNSLIHTFVYFSAITEFSLFPAAYLFPCVDRICLQNSHFVQFIVKFTVTFCKQTRLSTVR